MLGAMRVRKAKGWTPCMSLATGHKNRLPHLSKSSIQTFGDFIIGCVVARFFTPESHYMFCSTDVVKEGQQ
jgi:hypothetical protein